MSERPIKYKIYSGGSAFFFIGFLVFAGWFNFFLEKNKFFDFYFFSMLVVTFFWCWEFYRNLVPFMSYDENGCEVRGCFSKNRSYKWVEIQMIFRASSDSTWAKNIDGKVIFLGGKALTKEYLEHLSRIVGFVQKENTAVRIEPFILNMISEKVGSKGSFDED